MNNTQEYLTPDQNLRLLVIREAGDVTIGFDGYSWHTHGDVLVGEYQLLGVPNLTPESATAKFLQDLLADRITIAISRTDGKIDDCWVSFNPSKENKYLSPGEEIELRFWSGAPWVAS